MRAVFVLFDTFNRHDLGCYGGKIPTPNFDRFAKRGLTFDNHFVGSLPCMPARRDLHTGRMNFMHRSWGPLEPFDNSMPQLLGQAGIHTHLLSDHFHYLEDGGATYHNRYSTWDIIRGQEYDCWGALAKPPLNQFERDYSDKHYNSPAHKNRRQHQVNRSFIRREADFPGPQCFARAFEFLDNKIGCCSWNASTRTNPSWRRPGSAIVSLLITTGQSLTGPTMGAPITALTRSPRYGQTMLRC